ncbi:cobalt-precorrin-6B C5-methyltransferase, putative [Syntrophotalea carbinolica DSM 2380]|uniref:Cobalt-precorrin-6B C5-methyltransferase, putative n=1 Tax=Syntrophotalea carbinolica (strain DSM 2380 / NBRC 103641 / GraBd1) TaxID=338963 RepID=Q3A7B0_SYNC1|nr:precorrin-6y C5,15-methyltransferase (decarboxylating) subunit CbiE [Syntrophotalea carbinolica]ABA87734.1 cobalt-precorrin-6B C5-methyltransferase, putative [Syntrophotalea carbinolica DSM 2380]
MAITDQPITIVGCGPGGSAYLTDAARQAVNRADILIGANRLLALFPEAKGKRVVVGADIAAALEFMDTHIGHTPMVVLVTGDPGMHSLARPVVRHFGRKLCRIIPGISSVQAAFAAAGLDWMDARILSAHGALPDIDHSELDTVDKIAVLAGSPAALRWIAALAEHLAPRWVLVCEELTLPGETVTQVTASDLVTMQASSRTVVLLVRPDVWDV